jgi:Flp pilus assembly protein CpaB
VFHRSRPVPRRAALLWAAALVVGLATAVTVARGLAALRAQESAYGALHPVVVATRDLPLGHRVAAADLATRRVRGEAPAEGALTDPRAARGRVMAVAVLRGSPVTDRHLAPRHRDGRDGVVPAGRRAMRVVLEASTRATVGDLVDLYATFDPQVVGDDAEPTLTVARAVPVIAVDEPEAAAEGGALGLTVLVTPEEARRLAFASATGVLAAAVAPPEAARVPSRS